MPIYKELLYSGSRRSKDRSVELKRPAPSLVKIVCQAESEDVHEEPVDNTSGPRVGTREYFDLLWMCRFTTLWRILALDILISELSPACLTGISGCFFSLVFLFACFSFLCSLWLAFQVLPGPCNLHRPGGIPRIALGKGRKKKNKKKPYTIYEYGLGCYCSSFMLTERLLTTDGVHLSFAFSSGC